MFYPPAGSAPLPPAPAPPMSSDTNNAPAAPPMDPETAAQFRNYGYGSVPQRGGHHARGSAGHQHGHQAFRHAGQPGSNTSTPPPLPLVNGLPPPPPHAAPGFPGHPQAYPPLPSAHQHYATQASPSVGGPPAKRARYDQQHHPTHPGQTMAQPMQMQPNPSQPQQQQQHAAQGVYYPHHAYPATQQMTHPYPRPPLPQHPQMQHGQPQIHHPQQHQQQQAFYPGPAAVGSGHAAPMSQAMPMQQQQHQPVHNQGYPANSGPAMHGQQSCNANQHPPHHPQHSAMPPPLALPPMKAHRAPVAKPVPQGPPPPPLPPASLAPPPPPPPPPSQASGGPPSKHTTGTIRLDSKGAATLPPTPVGAAVYTGSTTSASASNAQQVSGQARDDGARRRDTRPIPASSSASTNGEPPRGSDEYRRDSVRERERDRDSRDSSSRGGGRGRGSLRGGRGGSMDSRRSYESRYQSSDNGSANHRTGGKRSFSQTGPGPSPSSADRPANKHGRSRADSNATVTSITYSNAPKQGKGKRDRERESSTRPGSVAGDAPSGSKGSKGAASTPNDSANNPLKKTLTDFRIESLEIKELGWMWTAKPPEKEPDTAKAVDDIAPDKNTLRTALDSGTDQAEHYVATSLPDADGLQVSLNLQRVDSRKEKRKHEDDEDDMSTQNGEGIGETVIESDRNDRDRGAKKVKAEILDEEKRSPPAEQDVETLPEITSVPIANQEESLAPGPAAEGAQSESAAPEETPPFAFSVEGQRPRRQSASASDTSDAEIAAAVIARPSSSPGKLPSVEPESEPVPEEAFAKSVETENFVPRISRTLPVTHSSQSKASFAQADGHDTGVSKGKNRENSRLRIYFSSPVALESKEGRKHLLSRSTNTNPSPSATGRNKRIKREPQAVEEEDLPRNVREASMESRITQVDEKASEASEHASDQDDDVDGVPIDDSEIAAKETVTTESADSTTQEVSSKDEEDDKTEVPQQKLSQVPVEEALPEPSPDRISISYAKNSRRLVIDANVVEEVCVHRAEAKIEIKIKLEPIAGHKASSLRYCQGVFLETLKHGNKFTEVDRQMLESEWPTEDAIAIPPVEPEQKNETDANLDQLLPPLHHLFSSLSLSQHPDGAKQKFADSAKEEEAEQPEGSEASSSKEALETKPSSSMADPPSPFRYNTITIVARLDRANPLTEAKWVRTGSPDDWIMSVVGTSLQLPKGTLSGPSSASPNLLPPVSAWKGKIKVADPDAPPTFQHALENWLSTRTGFDDLRYSFVATHFQDVRNILEVLLRLIRGPSSSNNSHPHHHQQHSQQHQQAGSVASQSLASDAPYPEQQTPISLAAFQLFKLGIEAAQDAGVPKAEIDRKIGEVVRNLPYSMIYRSLDSMYIDYKRSKAR